METPIPKNPYRKFIKQIQPIRTPDGLKVGWKFYYHEGSFSTCGCPIAEDSFAFDVVTARQLLQSLQEEVLKLEHPTPPLQGTESGVWMGDHVAVRLQPPSPEGG